MDDRASAGASRTSAVAVPRPLAASRRDDVLTAVRERGTVRVTELAHELGVTPVTVRRDVAELARAGLVRRVHGGATWIDPAPRDARADAEVEGRRTGRRRGRLGALVPALDYYWPDVVRGAEERCVERGWAVMLRGSSYDSPDERDDVARLVEARCAGLLLAPSLLPGPGDLMREWLAQAPVPVVLMERTCEVGLERRTVESVITDHEAGAAMAVHHLASLGHTRIGVALSSGSPHLGQILRGWRSAMVALGFPVAGTVDARLPDGRSATFTADIDAVLDRALESGTTGLLVHSDREAIGFLQRAEERGVRIPGDLSVVAYDDELAELATPALTAVRPPRSEIGRTAVSLLLTRMAEPEAPAHRVLVTPRLNVRASTAPPPR